MLQITQAIGKHRWARRLAWVLGGVLVFWVLAWLIVPRVARTQIERHASEALGRQVTVEKVQFLPWSLEASLHGLSIASQDGGAPQVQIARIYIDAELQSLFRWAPVIDAVQVDEPRIRVTQTAPGHYDFDDILARFAKDEKPAEADAPMPRFALYNIALNGGSVDFDDRTVDKVHTLRQVHLAVPFLSNLAADRQVKVTPRLAFELNGSPFDSSAQATPFAEGRQTQARLKIDGFDLGPFAGYVPKDVPVRLRAGLLDADLALDFEQEATPRIKISGGLDLRGVQLADTQGERLLDFDSLRVALKDVRPLQRVVEIESIDWQGARAQLRRDASGALAIPGMAAQPASAAAAELKEPAEPWQFKLDRLSLRNAAVDWLDASLPGGQAAWKADDLQLDASAIALPLQQPLRFGASARLSGGGVKGEATRLAVEGQATGTRAQAAVSVRSLPAALGAPYLAGVLKPSVSGMLDADIGLAKDGDAMVAKVAKLSLDKAALHCVTYDQCQTLRRAGIAEAGKDSMAELGRLEVNDALVLLHQRQLDLGRVALQQPRLLVARTAQGAWMFEEWLAASAPAKPAAPAPASAPQKPWALKLAALEVNGASVAYRDAAAVRPVALNLSALQARLKGVSFADGRLAPVDVRLDTRVAAGGRAEPGRLGYEGSIAMAPALTTQGKVRAQNLPLHAFEPYVAQDLNVDIRRADGSFSGDVHYTQHKDGPLVAVKGDASLDDVRVRVAAGDGVVERGEELLRWKSLGLRGVAVDLKPGRPLALDVRETALHDFFARIVVQENGRINLQDIRKSAASEEAAAPAAGHAAAAPAADPMAPVIRFGPVTLANGSVRFTDHFIKPNYSADLSELAGRISAFSSVAPPEGGAPQMADLELRGRAQGTASLEVTGKLNPLVKPLALDIRGRMRDMELPPLSPYSVKYAGHGIERGKLSMDVSYTVQPDGQLTASNKLVLNQLSFGDPVEGAPASLPVRLAVALLADRNGVIDVDLPISGSLNDPEFRIGPVILKVIGNLIMKAVTAPFSLLAGAFSGADEQGAVHFAAGSAVLDAKAREQLDKIAGELNNRPALKVTVTGWAQPEAEQDAWKRLRLRDMAQAQKRRAAVREGAQAADVPPMSDVEYPALLQEAYKRADIKKPRNMIGMAKDVPQGEMEALLLQSIDVPANAMSDLALARGVAVRDYLASKEVALDRLFVGASKLQPADKAPADWKPRAELELTAR